MPGIEHPENPLGFLDTVRQRLLGRRGILPLIAQGEFRRTPQSGQRGAEIMGHVVERLPHGPN